MGEFVVDSARGALRADLQPGRLPEARTLTPMAVVEPQDGEDPSDPQRSGHSLANLWELVSGCLDACEAKSVAEIGAFAGDLTRRLLDWAEPSGARVIAIDPFEHPWLVKLAKERPDLDLVAELSHDALSHIPLPDAVIVDGDHNYFTVSEELRVIAERAPAKASCRSCLFHDVCWPHGRRDAYWAPDRIPPEHRQPLGDRATLFPGNPGTADEGLVLPKSAAQEGGPRNGVLTAIEDFVADRSGLSRWRSSPPSSASPPSGTLKLPGQAPSPRSSRRGTGIRRSPGSRRTVCSTSRPRALASRS